MNETVTMPKDDYLRLKAIQEDMANLNSAADVLARITAGTEELIPSAVVDRLLAGDAPLTVCGIAVGVLGDAGATCTAPAAGSGGTTDGTTPVVDVDAPISVCGIGIGVLDVGKNLG